MKITKRQLIRIIKEEKAKMLECPGDDMHTPNETTASSLPVTEAGSAEHNMLVEMELASRALGQVVESVQNAASLCPGCQDNVALQAPVMEAMVAQAEALKEMVEAQVDVVAESVSDDVLQSVEVIGTTPVIDVVS